MAERIGWRMLLEHHRVSVETSDPIELERLARIATRQRLRPGGTYWHARPSSSSSTTSTARRQLRQFASLPMAGRMRSTCPPSTPKACGTAWRSSSPRHARQAGWTRAPGVVRAVMGGHKVVTPRRFGRGRKRTAYRSRPGAECPKPWWINTPVPSRHPWPKQHQPNRCQPSRRTSRSGAGASAADPVGTHCPRSPRSCRSSSSSRAEGEPTARRAGRLNEPRREPTQRAPVVGGVAPVAEASAVRSSLGRLGACKRRLAGATPPRLQHTIS